MHTAQGGDSPQRKKKTRVDGGCVQRDGTFFTLLCDILTFLVCFFGKATTLCALVNGRHDW